MEEENRSFSWSGLFIKIILVVIFIIFTVWLLSLSTKDMSDSLDVLTDDLFTENLERMKKVGKEYFTKEKLPLKTNDIKTLTLEEMYEQKLILEIKDKNGDACSKEKSYVSVEKFDNEYQMKVYLECNEEKDHIIVIMNCSEFGTCVTTNDDKPSSNPDKKPTTNGDSDEKQIEYEYKKVIDGSWSDWGEWSEWSKVEITELDNRDVETKIEKETYTYYENVPSIDYKDFGKTCPEGYKLTQDKTKCYKIVTNVSAPQCNDKANLVSQNGFECKYIYTESVAASCPAGYDLIGGKCMTTKPSYEIVDTVDPDCPKLYGYLKTGGEGFTCNYTKYTYDESNPIKQFTAKTVPEDNTEYVSRSKGLVYVYENNIRTPMHLIYQYDTILEKEKQETRKASCKEGYAEDGDVCNKYERTMVPLEEELTCPVKAGYEVVKNNNTCTYTKKETKEATCPIGYTKQNNQCVESTTTYEDYTKTCPSGYTLTTDGKQCQAPVTNSVPKKGEKEVTYYRYRLREYLNGTTLYAWSTSKSDKKLLDDGYKLTGRTR